MKFGCLKNGSLFKFLICGLFCCCVGFGSGLESKAVLSDKIRHFGIGNCHSDESDLCDNCKITYSKDKGDSNRILLNINVEAKGFRCFVPFANEEYDCFLSKYKAISSVCSENKPLKFALFKDDDCVRGFRECRSCEDRSLKSRVLAEGELQRVMLDLNSGVAYFSGSVPLDDLIRAYDKRKEGVDEISSDEKKQRVLILKFFVNSVDEENYLGCFAGDSVLGFDRFYLGDFIDEKGKALA